MGVVTEFACVIQNVMQVFLYIWVLVIRWFPVGLCPEDRDFLHHWKSRRDSITGCIVGLFGVGMNFRPLFKIAFCLF